MAWLPPWEQECLTCRCKFESHKTVKRHKCSKDSKVVCKKEADAPASGSCPVPHAQLNTLASSHTPLAPTAPSHSSAVPPVTGDLGVPSCHLHFLQPPLDATLIESLSHSEVIVLMKKMKRHPKLPLFNTRFCLLQGRLGRIRLAVNPGLAEEIERSRKWRWQ